MQQESKRNFPNFLDAYFAYSQDNFCPDVFHRWIGFSILAAAVQRKISLKDGKIYHVPNIYTMLVSHPATGKSTAIERGVELLEGMKKEFNPDFRIIPNQTTEPAFIDMMKIVEYYGVGEGNRIQIPHSSGFFYASEASASALQNTCGDFVASLTAFYDCPKFFRKKLKGERDEVSIENSCMNVLAGSTFNYLKNLVDEVSVMGGFASRLIYVVENKRKIRKKKWGEVNESDAEIKAKLIADLAHINKLAGPMKPTPEFIAKVEEWQPKFDQYLQSLNSEKMESIMGRKGTNLIKIAMLLSISESDDLVVTGKHFDQAEKIIEEVTKDNHSVISSAIMGNVDSQTAINLIIMKSIGRPGEKKMLHDIKRALMKNGVDANRMGISIQELIASKSINQVVSGSGIEIELLVEPNSEF